MIDAATPNRRKVDAASLVRLRVDQIVGQTAPVLNLVVPMIAVVTRNRRQVDAVISAHRRVDQIAGLTVLALSLVGRMIDDATPNRLKVDVAASAPPPVVRAETLVRRSAAPVTIAAASAHLTVEIAVASLRNMAVVTIVDAATSVLRSVDRVTIAATWGLRRTITAAVPIVDPVTLPRHTAAPIVDTETSVRQCTGRPVSATTSARHPAIVATNVVATAIVLNRRCGTGSRSSAFVW